MMMTVTESQSREDAGAGHRIGHMKDMKDKRHVADIAALRQGVDEGECMVCWKAGTKAGANKDVMRRVSIGKDGMIYEQKGVNERYKLNNE